MATAAHESSMVIIRLLPLFPAEEPAANVAWRCGDGLLLLLPHCCCCCVGVGEGERSDDSKGPAAVLPSLLAALFRTPLPLPNSSSRSLSQRRSAFKTDLASRGPAVFFCFSVFFRGKKKEPR